MVKRIDEFGSLLSLDLELVNDDFLCTTTHPIILKGEDKYLRVDQVKIF